MDGASRGGWPFRLWLRLSSAPGLTLLVMGLVFAAVLALPGDTVVTRGLEDLFATLDGVQRLASGQVPHRDFQSTLGPLAYYVPGLGFWLTGSFGAALPVGMALLTLALALVLAHVLPSRLSPGLALPFGFLLLIVLAAPTGLGDPVTAISFSQFFDRIGWVGLSALLVLFLPVREGQDEPIARDSLAAIALTLLLLYTKLAFGLIAIAFLLLLLTDRRQWRWLVIALLGVAAAVGIVELLWRGSETYIDDTLRTVAIGGWLRGTVVQRIDLFLANLADYLLLGVLAVLLFWRRLRMRDLLFVLLCGATGFWLLDQSDQRTGILTVLAAAVVVAERLLLEMHRPHLGAPGKVVNPMGVQLYVLGLLLPTMVHFTIALGLHGVTALVHGGEPTGIPRLESVRIADLWTPRDFGGSRWYRDTITDGLSALEALDTPPGRIVVLGGANPYSVALDAPPAAGDMANLRWGVDQNPQHHLAPEVMLGNADTVMQRLAAGGIEGPNDPGPIYLPYVREHFRIVAETPNWRIYGRSAAP